MINKKSTLVNLIISTALNLSLFPGCSPDFTVPISPSSNVLFVATTDSVDSASYSTIDLYTKKSYNDIGSSRVHTDIAVRYFQEKVFIINRMGRDNIQILDPRGNYEIISEISLRKNKYNYPNPSDVALINNYMYVSLYNEKYIAVIDINNNKTVKSIDISGFGYNGSFPCAASMYYYEKKGLLFVTLQRLDTTDWTPKSYGMIIAIDTAVNEIVQKIPLVGVDGENYMNPYSLMRFISGKNYNGSSDDYLFVSCVGKFNIVNSNKHYDGGIIKLSISDDSITVDGVVVRESSMESDITDFVVLSESEFYMTTIDEKGNTRFVFINPDQPDSKFVILMNGNKNGYLWRIESYKDDIYICDKNIENPGIRIFNTGSRTLSDAVYTGLPPEDLVVVE